jgi:adenylosuccinate lyase
MADNAGILEVPAFSVEASQFLTDIVTNFSLTDAQAVKDIEKTHATPINQH